MAIFILSSYRTIGSLKVIGKMT